MTYTNLLSNAGFESAGTPVDLNGGTSSYAVYSTTVANSGTHSLKVSGTREVSLTPTAVSCVPTDKFYVQIYVLQASGYTACASNLANLSVAWFNGTTLVQTSICVDSVDSSLGLTNTNLWPNATWIKLSGYFQAPSSVNGLKLLVDQTQQNFTGEVLNVFYWDDAVLYKISDSDYATRALGGAGGVGSEFDWPVGDTGSTGPNTAPDTPVGYPVDTAIPQNVNAITYPPAGGIPTGSSYLSLSEYAAKSDDDWLTPIHARETKRWQPFGHFLGTLLDAILGLPIGTSGSSTILTIYTALSGMKDHSNESFRTAIGAKIANEASDAIVDWKAAAGSNLVLSPHFNDSALARFPMNDNQFSGYAIGEEHHSGLQAWKWSHYASTDSGFQMAPTTRIKHFEVRSGEVFLVEAWVFPKATNTTSPGEIRIGGTISDTTGTLSDTDIYTGFPQNGPDMVAGQWNKINISVTIPTDYNKAVFWVKSTANTTANNVFWLDDVLVRENTAPAAAQAQANWAEVVTNVKSSAGANLVLDPQFGLGALMGARFPYNIAQVCDYSNTQAHSGIVSWKWTQKTAAACGLILNPTAKVSTFGVKPGEAYYAEAWLYWPSTNSGTAGSYRIGATFSDSTGVTSPSDLYTDYPISGITANTWKFVQVNMTVPAGMDTAKFWVIATSSVAANNVVYVDDVTVKEVTHAQSVVDSIHQAVNGGSSTNRPLQTVLDNVKLAWANFWDGLNGTTGATAKLPADVYTAAAAVKTQAGTAYTNNQNTNLALYGTTTTGSTILTAAVPNLPQSQITNLTSDMGGKLATAVFNAKAEAGANLCYAPFFEDSGITRYGYNTLTYAYSTAQKHSGTQSLMITMASASDNGIRLRSAPNTDYFPVRAGDVYYIECYLRAHSSNNTSSSYIGFGADCSNSITGTLGSFQTINTDNNAISTSSWTKLSGYVTMPANCDQVIFYIYFGTNFTGNKFYLDDITIREVTKANELNQALYAQSQPASTVLSAVVPGLDAAKITTGSFGTGQISNSAITTAKIAASAVDSTLLATDAVTTSAIANNAVTGGKTSGLDASKLTGGTVANGVLPSALTTVGSGFVMRKTSGTVSVSCSANTATAIKFNTSIYDSTASNTGDYTLSTGGSSELKVTANNAGWYMVEVAFGLDQSARAIGYRLSAALFLNGSIHKIGSTVDYYGSLSTQYPFSCQASFIVYLSGSDYVTPGCMLYSQSTISSLPLVVTNMNKDFYFSVSLLNRTL